MQSEPIYKGATRPAMKLGVPLVPLVMLLGAAMLLVLWVGLLVTWWIVPVVLGAVVPALGAMRLITRQDDQRLRQWGVALRLRWSDAERRAHLRSYSPYLPAGTSDDARR